MSVDVSVHLCLLQCVLNVLLRLVLAVACELVVELNAAVRRSVSLNLDVLYVVAFLVGVDLLEHLYELLNRVVLELALADVSLVDEELDVSLLLLSVYALESVGSDASGLRCNGILVEFRCSYNAVSHLH